MAIAQFRIGSALRGIIVNAGWLFVLRAVRILFALFVGVWVARYLGPGRFGDLSYALAFVTLFVPLTTLGLTNIVVRDLVREPRAKEEILGTAFLLRLAGGVISVAVILVVISIIRAEDALVRMLTGVVAIGIVFQAFDTIDIWFQSEVQSKYAVYSRFVALVLANAVKIVLILRGAQLVAFAWVAVFEMAVTAAGFVVAYHARGFSITAWRVRLSRARNLLGQSWMLMLSGALTLIYLKIDQVMLGEMSGREEVGIYSTAVRISEIWYFVPMAISMSVFPALIRSRDMGREIYEKRLQQLYDFLVWLALCVALVMTFLASPIVRLLFGEAYAGGGPILAIHVWAGIFVFMKSALARWLLNEGLLRFLFLSNSIGAVVNIVLNLFLIPKYGGVGAAIATVISYAAAGYLATFLRPDTVPAGRMMSLALIVPLRTAVGAVRRIERREGGGGE
jgi:PST family polysaccharide transporter